MIGAPVTLSEVLLPPSDRADIAVGPFAEGETIRVESLPYHRKTIARSRTELFATVRIGPAAPSIAVIPSTLRTIEPLVTGEVTATREVHLGERMSLMHGAEFSINGARGSPGCPTTGRASGCTTATSSSTTRPG